MEYLYESTSYETDEAGIADLSFIVENSSTSYDFSDT